MTLPDAETFSQAGKLPSNWHFETFQDFSVT